MENKIERICVLGLGYIGLPTAALLANKGYSVHGVDVDKHVVNTVNSGKIHIVEVGLGTFVYSAVLSGNLKADIKPKESDVFIIAVPTPFHNDNSKVPTPNIDFVISATKSIAPYLKKNNLIILESTSPVGTTEKITKVLAAERPDLFFANNANEELKPKFYISHCPERVLPGKILVEIIENDRIVGGLNKESTQKTAEFYNTFVEGKILQTDTKTAEMAKLTENSFRDVNIAFANELSIICDRHNINVQELIKLANHHPRVNILRPGVGVGGHCIAVDPWFIVSENPDCSKLIQKAREINNYKTEWCIEKIKNTVLEYEKKYNTSPTIALMGLAFKPDINDLRESPAVRIARYFKSYKNSKVLYVEPNLVFSDEFELVPTNFAINKADIIVFLVAHKEFKNISISNKQILDFCEVKKFHTNVLF